MCFIAVGSSIFHTVTSVWLFHLVAKGTFVGCLKAWPASKLAQPASAMVYLIFLLLLADSPVHASSTPVSLSPSLSTGNLVDGHHNYLEAPANTSRALPSPMSAIGSPVNTLGSPYRVIASSVGSHPVTLSSAPGMNFVTHTSPQVGRCPHLLRYSSWCSEWVKSQHSREWAGCCTWPRRDISSRERFPVCESFCRNPPGGVWLFRLDS